MQIVSQCCGQRRRGVHCPPCLEAIPNFPASEKSSNRGAQFFPAVTFFSCRLVRALSLISRLNRSNGSGRRNGLKSNRTIYNDQ